MIRTAIVGIAAMMLFACTSREVGPYAPTAEDKRTEALAAQNAMCRIENQARCAHVIENRILMSRFFAPENLGGMREDEKFRGRRITTRFISEAVAGINQCQRVTADSIVILRDIQINGSKWLFKATKPANENAACFITPFEENS